MLQRAVTFTTSLSHDALGESRSLVAPQRDQHDMLRQLKDSYHLPLPNTRVCCGRRRHVSAVLLGVHPLPIGLASRACRCER